MCMSSTKCVYKRTEASFLFADFTKNSSYRHASSASLMVTVYLFDLCQGAQKPIFSLQSPSHLNGDESVVRFTLETNNPERKF